MKLINVIDENGKSYSSTYVKRAKGLVKYNRAYWVDDSTICLRMPQQNMEVKILKASDFERMIALTVAGNYAIKNRNKEECYMAFTTIKTLCDTYDGIISELEKANIEINPGLGKICFDEVQDNNKAIVLRDLEQLVYTKNCLLNPILKLEKSKAEKTNSNSQSKEVFSNSKIKITVEPNEKTKAEKTNNLKKENLENSKLRDSKLEELEELEEELEELEEELEEINEELQSSNQELKNAKKELADLLEELRELEIDINDIKLDINNEEDEEELEDLKEELEDKESDLKDVLSDIDSTREEISELEEDIKENEEAKEDIEIQIKTLKGEINRHR